MATAITKLNSCLMCLDAPAVHTVENCQHSFCEACLTSYQNDNDKAACPACKGECRQTTVQMGNDGGEDTDGQATEGGHENPGDLASLNKFPECAMCFFKGTKVMATQTCVGCKNIPMCKSCIQDHGKNRITQQHVFVDLPISFKQYCDTHGKQLELFCKTCKAYTCYVCLQLAHRDHDIEPMADIIRNDVTAIQTALEFEQGRPATLQGDETYLQESKATAQDMEDTLIKAIEDHTEKVIQQALTNKDTLKKEVRSTFKLIGTFAKWLDAIPELLKMCKGVLARGEKVLHEAELDSNYVDKLRGLKQDLEQLKSGEADYDKEKETYKEAYKKLCEDPMKFYPRSPNMNIGGFVDPGPGCDAGGSCVCVTCQKMVAKLPHPNRVGICRNKQTCMCGTCGSVFHRSKMDSIGRCANYKLGSYCYSYIASPFHQ